ncbi:unnamed protein product [Phyllotreta striolata]|uniref:Uncharacterized protein n=1 Tax=Phyllotreta striolata TaxID=444603 RepID=A0A9N9TFZ5_PHYSR|nr:unnamed protein product [Phyllotreta striolata]
MLKRNQKQIKASAKSDNCNLKENEYKSSEISLTTLIGVRNLKRWNALKIEFRFQADEEFVTKLLDLAEDYLNKTQRKPHTNHEETSTKKLEKNPKHHIDTNPVKEELNEDVPQLQEKISNYDVKNIIGENKTQSAGAKLKEDTTRLVKKVTLKKEGANKKGDKTQLPLKDLKQCDNKNADNTEKSTEKENKPTNNVDKIRIKLCQLCNTHHVQVHCPLNFPHYVVHDAFDPVYWEQKYKLLHEEAQTSKEKTDNSELELYEYSFSVLSLPNSLYLKDTNSTHGTGVFAKIEIEPFTQFGPLIGKTVKEMEIPEDINMKNIWEIQGGSENVYFDTENVTEANWCKYLRPAPTRDDKNLTVIAKDSKLFFVSVKFIKIGEELLFWQDSQTASNKKKMEKTTCGGCNIDFSHPHYYRLHCSLFHDIRYSLTIKKYHCKVCGVAVLGKENIMKHAAELHNGQGAYQCQFCKKFFLRLNYLEMHRTYGCSANPHRSRPLCDFCGRKFCQPQKLKVHIKRMHSDLAEVLKEFQCKSCLKILGSRAALQRHTKEVHKKQTEANCSCSRCGKSFQNKSNLKIHMLTHSGIKPFKCIIAICNAAFTTKQCLQFHYKKIHNYTEENMPKIERSVDYTFQAYSGSGDGINENEQPETSQESNSKNRESMSDDGSDDNENIDDPLALTISNQTSKNPVEFEPNSPQDIHAEKASHTDDYPKSSLSGSNLKVLSKGSKKWIGDDPPASSKLHDIYSVERLSKDDLSGITLQETDDYDRNKTNANDFNRHEASNASLLVEAALDSVCNEPNIDIDVGTTPNCADSLVNNLYNLAQSDNLPDVSYNDINDSRDISLISPSVNDHDHVSVTDELNDELRRDNAIGMHYSGFHQNDFSPPHSPDIHRSNFVRNYINSLSPQNVSYDPRNPSPVPSPSRYDIFAHHVNPDHLSSDDSNGMTVQNLSLHNAKNDIQLDLSLYKTYKSSNQDYIRKLKFDDDNTLEQDHIDVISQDLPSDVQGMEGENKGGPDRDEHDKYELSADIRNKFDIDLDLRLKAYDTMDAEALRQRNHTYETSELDFRSKAAYDLIDAVENRNKQYDLIDNDFRTDRNFEPLILNSSELQGLDMSARSFHNYTNINRYRPLYPEVDRVDLRLNYSPPPPTYTHADLLRVVSLDLTPPGRHSVDLSLRNHPLHQIANSRLLTEHGLQPNPHRLLDQSRILNADLISSRHLATDRLITEQGNRILTDHSTSRILNNEQLGANHLLAPDQSRIIGDDSRVLTDQTRLLDQSRLIGDGRILPPTTPNGGLSPVQGFGSYTVPQNPYHPAPLATRPHVTSPTTAAYHYPTYY